MWITVVCVVLAVLFVETQGNRTQLLNFMINTGDDDIDAEVVIDNQKVGTISSSSSQGPGGGVFIGYLQPGKHLVQIRKQGFKPFSKQIDMHHELYLGVDLEPVKD